MHCTASTEVANAMLCFFILSQNYHTKTICQVPVHSHLLQTAAAGTNIHTQKFQSVLLKNEKLSRGAGKILISALHVHTGGKKCQRGAVLTASEAQRD